MERTQTKLEQPIVSMPLSPIPVLLLTFLLTTSSVGAQEIPRKPSSIATIATSFVSEEGFVFDARILAPPEPDRNDYGILMLGGGIGNDLDWTLPGYIDVQGQKKQFTISGKRHADAPLISMSLAKRGFVVMHWSTIRRNDPKYDDWPNEMTLYSIKDLLRFSKSALVHFRSRGLFNEKKVILLGHSLGAARAANIAINDNQIDAMVLLGAARLTRTTASNLDPTQDRSSKIEFMQFVDSEGDGTCSQREFADWTRTASSKKHPLANQPFERLDFDSDQKLVDWEISAGFDRQSRLLIDFKDTLAVDSSGLRWTEDILCEKEIDTLIVYGALDNRQARHAPLMADRINREKLSHVEIKIVPNVGHQLGPEKTGLPGPISEISREMIADWLTKRISSKRPAP